MIKSNKSHTFSMIKTGKNHTFSRIRVNIVPYYPQNDIH